MCGQMSVPFATVPAGPGLRLHSSCLQVCWRSQTQFGGSGDRRQKTKLKTREGQAWKQAPLLTTPSYQFFLPLRNISLT